jgi:hypothetical protein
MIKRANLNLTNIYVMQAIIFLQLFMASDVLLTPLNEVLPYFIWVRAAGFEPELVKGIV